MDRGQVVQTQENMFPPALIANQIIYDFIRVLSFIFGEKSCPLFQDDEN